MFKKTNNPQPQQSSESQLSSDNEVTNLKGNHKVEYEPSQGNSSSSSSSSSQQELVQKQGNRKVNGNVKNGYIHGNGDDDQDSLDNQDSDQDEHHHDQRQYQHGGKSNSNNKKHMNRQLQEQSNSSQEEDSSDQSGTAYFRSRDARNGISTIRQDPKQSIQDESMDHIEMRIKKLQKDLETRLHKHQQKAITIQQKNHGKIVSKVPSHPPPVPQKKASLNSNHSNNQSENKMNTVNVAAHQNVKLEQPRKQQKKQVKETPGQITLPPSKEKKTKKDENPQIKQSTISSKPASQSSKSSKKAPSSQTHTNVQKHKKQQVISKHSHHNQQKPQFFHDILPSQANNTQFQHKINEMNKIIKQLKLQNQVLKQKLQSKIQNNNNKGGNNQKGVKRSKSKNKMLQQLEKIRDNGNFVDENAKLQKQIELLQVIEKLQMKLKKSINKKLAKQNNIGTNLLHRGLPATIQSNI